jgi:DNA-binding beta-propeller fold protein YncE
MKSRLRIYNNTPSFLLLLTILLVSAAAVGQSRRLITGKNIVWPPVGTQLNVGSLPMNMVLSPNGKYAIVSDMGFEEALTVVSTKTGGFVSNVDYPNCNYCNSQTTNGLYYGLAFGSNGTLYAAQGGNNTIDVLNLADDGVLADLGSFTATQPTDFPSGLATDTRGYLYVVNNDPATFAAPGSVAIYSQATQKEVGRYSFTSFFGTPNFPLAIAVLSDGSKTYVSSERDGMVYDLKISDPTNPTLTAAIPTGSDPDGLVLNQAQTLLYVANAGSDTVSVVRTSDDTIVSSILLRPTQLKNVAGTSTPTGLGLSPDGRTLYVTLGDLNAVAVLDLNGEALALKGYIPTGWYPSSVVAPTRDSILFANAKGTTPRYPNPGYVQWAFNSSPDYDMHLIEGQVSRLDGLNDEKLARWSNAVVGSSAASSAMADHRLDSLKGKIKHVIYIVKENRTYDQVLGDVPGGNGDPSLTLFGADVTPNLHALAQRFVLLDNTYVDSEVSYDGWSWSTQGIATEDTIKSAPYNYSGRGRQYDTEGQNNGYNVGGFPAKDPDGNVISPVYFPSGAPPIPDITQSAGGHIWEAVQKAGLTYRNYGFFLSFGFTDGSGNVIMPDNYPDVVSNQPPGHDLAGVTDWDFRRFDGNYADSEAPLHYSCNYPEATYGKSNSPSRYSEWAKEFAEMLAKDPAGNSVPAFMTARFMKDHTQGPSSGLHTPVAEVADNDYAVGQLVQTISHSPIWKSTAIFIVEDDSQDGPDHVDAHRATAYVVSPWIKQSSIDHAFHNTTGMLKTMEMVLGLPPLASYDAIANPIMDWDSKPSNNATYSAILPAQSVVCAMTPAAESLATNDPMRRVILETGKLDFTHPDSAPDRKLNELIWKSVKGANSEPPASPHTVSSSDGDDD